MKIEFTGRQTEVPVEMRRLAQRKLEKLAKVLPGITRAHVILAQGKNRQIAEVSVHSPHLTLTAQEESPDLGASLATVIERITRQAQRQRGRRWESKRRGSGRVIRSRRRSLKPMTVDEAAQEVGRGGVGFLVFRDAATERVSVLYRRKDGHLGLIEPEA